MKKKKKEEEELQYITYHHTTSSVNKKKCESEYEKKKNNSIHPYLKLLQLIQLPTFYLNDTGEIIFQYILIICVLD